MKFLIIQKVKREVPIEKWAKLFPLQFKYFDNLEKEKTLEVYYHLIGQQGSMLIAVSYTHLTLPTILRV